MDAADGGTRVLIGRCGNSAGIQDDDFGFHGGRPPLHPAAEQLALDGSAIGLGRTASEVLDMISRHERIILGWLLKAGSADSRQEWTAQQNEITVLSN